MKKFLAAIMACSILIFTSAITYTARAQITRQITIAAADDTLTNADTATVALVFDGSWKSVEAWAKRAAGHPSGKIVFQGEFPHGGVYAGLDSLTVTDTTGAFYKLFTVPSVRLHKSYRLLFLNAGSGTSTTEIKAYYVRYTGGAILRDNLIEGLAFLSPNNKACRESKITRISRPEFHLNYINGSSYGEKIVGRLRLSRHQRQFSVMKEPLTS